MALQVGVPFQLNGGLQGGRNTVQGSNQILQGSSPQLQVSNRSGQYLQPTTAPAYNQNLLQPVGGGINGQSQGQLPQQNTFADGTSTANAQSVRDASDNSAYYGEQINQLNNSVGRLDSQQAAGQSNIENSYNSSYNRLNTQKSQAQQNYDIQSQDNTSGYSRNRSAIGTRTASRANALQRLLGIAGSGNSSAAYEAAPYAAGLQGTQDLNDAQTNYATNSRNLDLGRKSFLDSYDTNLTDLNQQKYSQTNKLKSSIATTRAGLLDQLRTANVYRDMSNGSSYGTAAAAQAGYGTQVNNLLNSIGDLGRQYENPVIQTGNVALNVPSLAQYSLNRGGAPTTNQGGTSSVDPTFSPILNQQRDRFGNIIN